MSYGFAKVLLRIYSSEDFMNIRISIELIKYNLLGYIISPSRDERVDRLSKPDPIKFFETRDPKTKAIRIRIGSFIFEVSLNPLISTII